jgi:hypothetical protein
MLRSDRAWPKHGRMNLAAWVCTSVSFGLAIVGLMGQAAAAKDGREHAAVASASAKAPEGAKADDTGAQAKTPSDLPPRVLTTLPKPPSLDVPPPDPASIEALDTHLSHLVSHDPGVRESAVSEILEVEADRLPAIHRRLATLAESSDHEAMRDLLSQVKDKTRDAIRGEREHDKDAALDYLEMLESHAHPDAKTWRDLVSVVAMSRMLRQIGSVNAARELVSIYARFGEFLRIEMQRQVERMGDHAVAALIEAERHPAPKIAQWAKRQLDALGKAIPGEAVQTSDPEALADILRAYGRARDPDAARLVISFANSERTQIREAARQAVVLMGEVATWQLRDTYENVVGKKPPREWSWERTARELFGEFDRLRLAQGHALFEEGLARERSGKLDEMAALFDQVLGRSPVFEQAVEMVPGYLAYAKSHLDDAPDRATSALRRVERLATTNDAAGKEASSLLATLEAEALFARHVADQTLVRRALDLNPGNTRARRLLDHMSRGDADGEARFHRYAAAGAVGVAAALALLFILLRKGAEPAPKANEPGSTPGSA